MKKFFLLGIFTTKMILANTAADFLNDHTSSFRYLMKDGDLTIDNTAAVAEFSKTTTNGVTTEKYIRTGANKDYSLIVRNPQIGFTEIVDVKPSENGSRIYILSNISKSGKTLGALHCASGSHSCFVMDGRSCKEIRKLHKDIGNKEVNELAVKCSSFFLKLNQIVEENKSRADEYKKKYPELLKNKSFNDMSAVMSSIFLVKDLVTNCVEGEKDYDQYNKSSFEKSAAPVSPKHDEGL